MIVEIFSLVCSQHLVLRIQCPLLGRFYFAILSLLLNYDPVSCGPKDNCKGIIMGSGHRLIKGLNQAGQLYLLRAEAL